MDYWLTDSNGFLLREESSDVLPEFGVPTAPHPKLAGLPLQWANGVWTPSPMPSITPLSARLVLRKYGVLEAFKAAVDSASAEDQDWFEYSTAWQRNSASVEKIAAILELNSIQLDAFFTEALIVGLT